ncbi:MAG: indolepyruvate ferredoxin oxidoreductase, partial [Desulfobacterales bacterium]|nr:indolepyruvate ferredoxin oxidoreductase [Desulfobacterales bacterium]
NLGEIAQRKSKAVFEGVHVSGAFVTIQHDELHKKLATIQDEFQGSAFNHYVGPKDAKFVIITSGCGWFYSQEAVSVLGLEKDVGILKIGTVWPLPEKKIIEHLTHAEELLIVEETDSFLEQNIKILIAEHAKSLGHTDVFGAKSGHLPATGDMNQDKVIKALSRIMDLNYQARDEQYQKMIDELALSDVPPRFPTFCAGCPHRASMWAIKSALKLDGRDGFVTGDIGCYALGVGPAGYFQLKTLYCMGSGIGLATGFGKLGQFNFKRPVVTVCGDSTFFHAAIPGLINARFNSSNVLMVVLDNGGTAMTGFQPHPGSGKDALGKMAPVVNIEDICESIGLNVKVRDPFEVDAATEDLYDLLQEDGAKVMIFRRRCFLVESREKKKKKVTINQEKCIGDVCGCNRFCSRVFNCPAIIYDKLVGKSIIDDALCTGCGVCASLCPQGAILTEGDDR